MAVVPCPGLGLGVCARIPLAAGTVVGTFRGAASARSRTSLQCGPELHVEPPDPSPLRCINHACDPTLDLHGLDLTTRRGLAAGEFLTLDYSLYESELVAPFQCACGAPDCLGMVRGFLHLDAAARAARMKRFPAWVRHMLDAPLDPAG